MFAEGDELQRLLQAFTESCRWAAELGCATVMSASDRGRGDPARAATNMREAGDIAAAHRVRLAVEFNSQAEQLNNLEGMRAIVARAAHPSCGLLLDTYHLQRSGATLAAIDDVALGEIAYVQYSDVPRTGLEPGKALDRLPPGRGSVPFKEIFGLLDRKGYRGFMSYEAPNPAAWARPADEVAREALEATRAHLPSSLIRERGETHAQDHHRHRRHAARPDPEGRRGRVSLHESGLRRDRHLRRPLRGPGPEAHRRQARGARGGDGRRLSPDQRQGGRRHRPRDGRLVPARRPALQRPDRRLVAAGHRGRLGLRDPGFSRPRAVPGADAGRIDASDHQGRARRLSGGGEPGGHHRGDHARAARGHHPADRSGVPLDQRRAAPARRTRGADRRGRGLSDRAAGPGAREDRRGDRAAARRGAVPRADVR